jgi:Histidine biosynthesis protein
VTPSSASRGGERGPLARGPTLVPCLLLRRGEVCLPGPDGPVRAFRQSGGSFDVFDIIDRLSPTYPFLYFADLDGLEENDPQLEYIQELSRDMSLWVDSGVRKADQAIDVLVAGAQKAVLSSAYLRGPKELRRAWKLSTELVFEVETVEGRLGRVDPGWSTADPFEIVRAARDVGVGSVVVSPRETDPDWSMVRSIAAGGPTWVDGTFSPNDIRQLVGSGAAGGIFHLDAVLAAMDTGSPIPNPPDNDTATRDDEN